MGLTGAKPVQTPIEQNVKFTSKEFDDKAEIIDPNGELFEEPEKYRRLIGKLLYLTMTRLDISYAVQTLSQFLNAPKKSHFEAVVRLVRYIKKAPGQGLLMSASSEEKLVTYCDLDWTSCLETRRSVSGYLVKLGDSLICWK